jgi:hypothetical protein
LQKIDSLYNHKATRLRTNPKQKRWFKRITAKTWK